MNPAHQVFWKELRLWIFPAGRLSRQFMLQAVPALLIVAVFAAFLLAGARAMEGRGIMVPVIAATSGASIGVALALDAFAGERERHTLETVLATPITPRQLLWGKMLAQFTVAGAGILVMSVVGLVLMIVLAADLVTVAIALILFPSVIVGAALFAVNLLLAANLASLRSSGVKATGPQMMTYFLLGMALFGVPPLLALLIAGLIVRADVGLDPAVMLVVALGIAGVLALLGWIAYNAYLIRAILLETRPERFKIDL